jgi:DNA-directed RNA polymerase subunit M/transcription elongation factor TFIIS
MEVNFCENCEFMTELQIEEGILYNSCHTCGHKKEVTEESKYIYEQVNEKFDLSEIINSNDYKTHDPTLPKISKNNTIKCVNDVCPSHNDPDSQITYFKYDGEEMKYLYVCDQCGVTWKTQNN